MKSSKAQVGVLIYTYNRTDDARINMEIIRDIWGKSKMLKDVPIVHSFNGEKEWWPEKYLEDDLLYLSNPGHFAGAEILINKGMAKFADKYPDVEHVIILASDTWCVKPEYIEGVIEAMKKENKYIAACAWALKGETDMFKFGMGLDFMIVNAKWSMTSGLFPIRFKEFFDKYSDLFLYQDQTIYLERVFALRFLEAIRNSVKIPSDNILKKISEEYVYRFKHREPVHFIAIDFSGKHYRRKMFWPLIGLITHHDPVEKRRVLSKFHLTLGEYGTKFLHAKDMSYFNRGLEKNQYVKGKKKIGYGD